MQDFDKQAEAALAAYLSRGQKALFLLRNDQFEAADDVLRLRTAAFHNLRVALAHTSNDLTGGDKSWQDMWKAIQRLDEKLIRLVEEKRSAAEKQVFLVRQQKDKIVKFRSAQLSEARFQKTV